MSQATNPMAPGVRPGTLLEGHWVVEALVRAGAAGVDLRCHHAADPTRRVVIKLFQDNDPDAWRRFQREAHVLKRVRHPTLVHAETAQLRADPPYLVLQTADGPDLRSVLRETGPMSLVDALAVARDLASLLVHLHKRSIHHRDIRPQNIVLTPQGPRVVQIGIGPEDGFGRLTKPGTRLGDFQYAPPEWATPSAQRPVQWDLYALGLTTYAMLTGEEPFEFDDSLPEVDRALRLTKRKRATPFLDPGPRFPEPVRLLVRALSNVDPDKRPQSAQSVYEQLCDLVAEFSGDAATQVLPPEGVSPTPPPTLTRPVRLANPSPPTLVPLVPRRIRGDVVVIPTEDGDAPLLVPVRTTGMQLSPTTVAAAMTASMVAGAAVMALFAAFVFLWLA